MRPLEGIKVLDLTRLLPGPLATMYLADYGAEVIKIEDPFIGDYARDLEPKMEGIGVLYQLVNRGKKSMTLNLQTDEGKEIFRKLVLEADVVIEGFRPGVMARFGLDYETVSSLHPGIIYCSISGYGQEGPYARKAGHDLNYIGFTGLLHDLLEGSKNQPVLPPVQIADIGGGTLHAVVGILNALIGRGKSGKGTYIDVSMTDGVFPFMLPPLGYSLAATGGGMAGFNPITGSLACYFVYKSREGRWFALASLEEKFFSRFCQVAELTHLLEDQWNLEKQDQLKKEIQDYFSSQTSEEILSVFANEDVCLTPVLSIEESMEDPQMKRRGIFQTFADQPSLLTVRNPLDRQDEVACYQSLPPEKGKDTEEILRELGYGEDALFQLKQVQVI